MIVSYSNINALKTDHLFLIDQKVIWVLIAKVHLLLF